MELLFLVIEEVLETADELLREYGWAMSPEKQQSLEEKVKRLQELRLKLEALREGEPF